MKIRRWGLVCLAACTNPDSPELDPVTGAHALEEMIAQDVENGSLSIVYSHDIQGETEPCG